MKDARLGAQLLAFVVVLYGAVRPGAAAWSPPPGGDEGRPVTVTGYIRDADCLFRNPDAGAPEPGASLECAISCVRGGSPLVVLSTDRKIYWALSDTFPGVAMNTKLLPYVGKLVKVSGKLFDRDGMRAIAVQQVRVDDSRKK